MDLFDYIRETCPPQQFNKNEKLAYERGYRIRNCVAYNPQGKKINTWENTNGYYIFKIVRGSRSNFTKKIVHVLVHRLVAYQKYGDIIFNFECVRHIDGNKSNNSHENIRCGSHKQNMGDVPQKVRMQKSVAASSKLRKFTNKQVLEIKSFHQKTNSYKKTMEKFDIKAKSTLWEILNRDYVTEKAG